MRNSLPCLLCSPSTSLSKSLRILCIALTLLISPVIVYSFPSSFFIGAMISFFQLSGYPSPLHILLQKSHSYFFSPSFEYFHALFSIPSIPADFPSFTFLFTLLISSLPMSSSKPYPPLAFLTLSINLMLHFSESNLIKYSFHSPTSIFAHIFFPLFFSLFIISHTLISFLASAAFFSRWSLSFFFFFSHSFLYFFFFSYNFSRLFFLSSNFSAPVLFPFCSFRICYFNIFASYFLFSLFLFLFLLVLSLFFLHFFSCLHLSSALLLVS